MNDSVNPRKVGIIGCGFVGSATAFALMQSGLFSEMVLCDVDYDKAEGEALDIVHGVPFASPMRITAGGYNDLADASVLIVTAGANQKPNETRLDLARKNTEVFRSVIPEIAKRNFGGILLVVTNPVDILTHAAAVMSGLPAHRVIGSGTVLDTARLKCDLGRHLGVDARSVHAFIVGEHGDSEIVVWSSATVSGVPLNEFCEMRGCRRTEETMRIVAEKVRGAAYEIIAKKHATYYGIAMSVRRICEAVVRDEKSVLPVSSETNGAFGIDGVVMSLPVVLGARGVETHVPIAMNEAEAAALTESARLLRSVVDSEEIASILRNSRSC